MEKIRFLVEIPWRTKLSSIPSQGALLRPTRLLPTATARYVPPPVAWTGFPETELKWKLWFSLAVIAPWKQHQSSWGRGCQGGGVPWGCVPWGVCAMGGCHVRGVCHVGCVPYGGVWHGGREGILWHDIVWHEGLRHEGCMTFLLGINTDLTWNAC